LNPYFNLNRVPSKPWFQRLFAKRFIVVKRLTLHGNS